MARFVQNKLLQTSAAKKCITKVKIGKTHNVFFLEVQVYVDNPIILPYWTFLTLIDFNKNAFIPLIPTPRVG